MSKPRPPNAAGPNGLRGGIKSFKAKTLTGPWLEELGGTAGFKRGFTSADYETEAQHQQLGAFKQSFPDFGCDLPEDYQIKRSTSPFKYEAGTTTRSSDISPWLTNTKLMGLSVTATRTSDDENNIYTTMLKPTLPISQLESYRKTWTHDNNDKFRSIRWTTETQNSLNSGLTNKQFLTTTIRLLPGTPKSFEVFRDLLINKYGILSFIVLKYEFYQVNGGNNDYNNHHTNEITIIELKKIINKLNINIKQHDVHQMIAYITPSSTLIPLDKFIYTVKGNMNQFQKSRINDVFQRIITVNELSGNNTSERVKLDHILQTIDSSEYPEIYEALSQYISIYSIDGTNIYSKHELGELLQDMYAASPDLYEQSLKAMWKV
mmetsp:Transcript_26199/g.28575  ORF Transcript_26199/g.28575 Transcript_26199/m.28575 type:complete len:377 (+) Transcript_26199:59-1189(+)